MINSREPAAFNIVRATVPPGDGCEKRQTDRNVRARASQWPMCQRDECWKLLGKRIRAVYVGQVARCQLLKCANFLKLQSFRLVMNLFTLFTLHPDCMDGCALLREGGGVHAVLQRSVGFKTSFSVMPQKCTYEENMHIYNICSPKMNYQLYVF